MADGFDLLAGIGCNSFYNCSNNQAGNNEPTKIHMVAIIFVPSMLIDGFSHIRFGALETRLCLSHDNHGIVDTNNDEIAQLFQNQNALPNKQSVQELRH